MGLLRRSERPVSGELMQFHRREQMNRLKRFSPREPLPRLSSSQVPADDVHSFTVNLRSSCISPWSDFQHASRYDFEAQVQATAGGRGSLTINADDWGRDRDNTDRTFQCVGRGTVTA